MAAPSPTLQQKSQIEWDAAQPQLPLASRDAASMAGLIRLNRTAVAASSANHHRKRSALAPRDANIPLKRQKQTHHRPAPTQTPPRLTENNLLDFVRSHNPVAVSFDGDAKSRAVQEAGKQLGFNLRLECYEQATTNIKDWAESSVYPMFRERPIFKDVEDVVAMGNVAKSFGVAPPQATIVGCQV